MRLSRRVCIASMVLFGVGILSGSNCPQNVPAPPGEPAEFTNANAARGGKLYDKWWEVNGAAEPTGNHSRYPAVGQKSGSTTFRCKECHGWDYKGSSGAYATGSSHFTGINGVFGTTLDAQATFDEIKAHAMPGLTDTDIWDLAKFVLDTNGAQFDTSTIIDGSGMFTGNAATGATLFSSGIGTGIGCAACHGADGKTINFGDMASPEFVGTVASDNPWEFQHKVRFGDAGAPSMPASVPDGGTTQDVADVGAHAATLPTS